MLNYNSTRSRSAPAAAWRDSCSTMPWPTFQIGAGTELPPRVQVPVGPATRREPSATLGGNGR